MFLDPKKESDFCDLGDSGFSVHVVKRVHLISTSEKAAPQASPSLPKTAAGKPAYYLKFEHNFKGDDNATKKNLRILNELFCSAIAAQVVKDVNRSRLRRGDYAVKLLIPQMGLVLSEDGNTLIGLYSSEVSDFSPFVNLGRSDENASRFIQLGIGINHALGYVLQDPDRNANNGGFRKSSISTTKTSKYDFDNLVGIDFGLAFYPLLRMRDALEPGEEGKILTDDTLQCDKKGDTKGLELDLIRSAYSLDLDCLVKNKDNKLDSIGLFKECGWGFYLALPTILADTWLKVIQADGELKSRLYSDLYSVFVVFPRAVETVKTLIKVYFKKCGLTNIDLESSDQCIKSTLDLIYEHADDRVKQVQQMIANFAVADAKSVSVGKDKSPRGVDELPEDSELVGIHNSTTGSMEEDERANTARQRELSRSPITLRTRTKCMAKSLHAMLLEQRKDDGMSPGSGAASSKKISAARNPGSTMKFW